MAGARNKRVRKTEAWVVVATSGVPAVLNVAEVLHAVDRDLAVALDAAVLPSIIKIKAAAALQKFTQQFV